MGASAVGLARVSRERRPPARRQEQKHKAGQKYDPDGMLQEFHRSSLRAISAGPEYAPQPRLRKAGEPAPSPTGLFSCPTRTRALSAYASALWAVWRATLDRRSLSPAASSSSAG